MTEQALRHLALQLAVKSPGPITDEAVLARARDFFVFLSEQKTAPDTVMASPLGPRGSDACAVRP
jgi:hypothetical protein